jgi:hypothetical protein
MTEVITVSTTVNTTTKLQAIIDKTGDVPTKYVLPAGTITIDSLFRHYNDAEFAGSGIDKTIFKLKNDVSPTKFGINIPLIGSKH